MSEEGESSRLFSVAEANELLEAVAPLVEALRDAQAVMDERQDDVMQSVSTNGGGTVHREFVDAAAEASRALEELQGLGLVVRDPSSGLVDFPSLRDGVEVFLCWRVGEPTVGWWHPPETGFAGRQPI